MGKKLIRVSMAGKNSWALYNDGAALALAGADSSLADLLARPLQETGERWKKGEYQLLSPVTAPCQIICQGKNYLDHMKEMGVRPEDKEFNLLFTKAPSSLSSASGIVQKPSHVKLLDYELELGLVIGKKISSAVQITEKNLHEYVCGVVMANDISARDVQVPERQWFKGKSFRSFCPVGPWIYLLDSEEYSLLADLQLELAVNGKNRQKASTKQLMYKPAETLQEISGIFDLYPGDLVLTGTPGGVAMRVAKKNKWQELFSAWKSEKEKMREFVEEQERGGRYLQAGDTITSSIKCADGHLDLGEQHLVVG